MPQLDKFSFFSQIFWFIFAFYTLYSFILIYIVPAIFRVLKYRIRKFELLIKYIKTLYIVDSNNKYITVLSSHIAESNKLINLFRNDYIKTLELNKKRGLDNLNLISKNSLNKIIFHKIKITNKNEKKS